MQKEKSDNNTNEKKIQKENIRNENRNNNKNFSPYLRKNEHKRRISSEVFPRLRNNLNFQRNKKNEPKINYSISNIHNIKNINNNSILNIWNILHGNYINKNNYSLIYYLFGFFMNKINKNKKKFPCISLSFFEIYSFFTKFMDIKNYIYHLKEFDYLKQIITQNENIKIIDNSIYRQNKSMHFNTEENNI